MSLGQLKEKCSLTNKDFKTYLQLCDCIRANQKGDWNWPPAPLGFRCGTKEGTFRHSTWQRSKLQGFGRGFVKRSNIHGVTFPLDPEICSLGNFTNYHLETNYAKKLTEILLTIPKKCIAIKWKSDAPLPIKMLLCEINSCVPLEKITYWMQKRWKSMEKLPLLGCVLWTDKTLLKISFYTRCKSWCKPVSQHYLTHSPFAHPW